MISYPYAYHDILCIHTVIDSLRSGYGRGGDTQEPCNL